MTNESKELYTFVKNLGDIGYGMKFHANDDCVLIVKDTWIDEEGVTDRIVFDKAEAIIACRAILKHFNAALESDQ